MLKPKTKAEPWGGDLVGRWVGVGVGGGVVNRVAAAEAKVVAVDAAVAMRVEARKITLRNAHTPSRWWHCPGMPFTQFMLLHMFPPSATKYTRPSGQVQSPPQTPMAVYSFSLKSMTFHGRGFLG
ncbi:hypothetical protein AB1Y20_009821 [Prymnesium parvum]|uniref:Uncharacterized protein n=1 Tax=Prymnesium parvum TaxID=97485 RepID=A0AB34K5I9_PRYPA